MKRVYAFIGRLSKEKGIYQLIDGWRNYVNLTTSDSFLKIYGGGSERENLKKYVKSDKTITLYGKASHEEILKQLVCFDAIIVPSIWYEGCPMTIIEAYSVGCPVIGSNIGNVNEMIREEITGTKFDPCSPKSIADAIIRFEKLDSQTLRNNVISLYNRKYSEDINRSILMDIYNRGMF